MKYIISFVLFFATVAFSFAQNEEYDKNKSIEDFLKNKTFESTDLCGDILVFTDKTNENKENIGFLKTYYASVVNGKLVVSEEKHEFVWYVDNSELCVFSKNGGTKVITSIFIKHENNKTYLGNEDEYFYVMVEDWYEDPS